MTYKELITHLIGGGVYIYYKSSTAFRLNDVYYLQEGLMFGALLVENYVMVFLYINHQANTLILLENLQIIFNCHWIPNSLSFF